MHLSFLGFPSHSTLVINSELDKAGHVILHLQMRKSRPNGVNQPAKVRPVQFPANRELEVVVCLHEFGVNWQRKGYLLETVADL